MSEKDFNNLMDLAQELLQKKISREEALRSLIQCGLVDETGKLMHPEVAPYLAATARQ